MGLSEPFEDLFSTPWSGLVAITADASCRGWGFLEQALSEF